MLLIAYQLSRERDIPQSGSGGSLSAIIHGRARFRVTPRPAIQYGDIGARDRSEINDDNPGGHMTRAASPRSSPHLTCASVTAAAPTIRRPRLSFSPSPRSLRGDRPTPHRQIYEASSKISLSRQTRPRSLSLSLGCGGVPIISILMGRACARLKIARRVLIRPAHANEPAG